MSNYIGPLTVTYHNSLSGRCVPKIAAQKGFHESLLTGFAWSDFGIPELFIAQQINQGSYLFITQTSICTLVEQTSHQFRQLIVNIVTAK
jgi:hypothetical protein